MEARKPIGSLTDNQLRQSVETINSDLTSTTDLTIVKQLSENADLAFIGDTKKGRFEIPGALAADIMAAPLNPNGRPNNDVVHPWINASDITRRRRDMWIIDFGVDMLEAEAALYERPYEYVRQHVKPARDKVRNR